MAKIERKGFATFIMAQTSTPAYELIGTDLEELNVDMNANVVKTANILGISSVSIDKYEKQSSIDPYKADSGTDLFIWLKEILDDELVLDDLNTTVVQCDLFGTETTGSYPAIEEDAMVEIVSYGGNTEGFQIPYNIHYKGIRRKGTFDPSTKTFTEAV